MEAAGETPPEGAQGSLKMSSSGESRSARQESRAGGGHWHCSEKGTGLYLLLKEFAVCGWFHGAFCSPREQGAFSTRCSWGLLCPRPICVIGWIPALFPP